MSNFTSGIFMNSELITKIQKNRLEEIRISLLKNDKVDVRSYLFFPQENEPKPTKKGVWLSLKQIPSIIKELEKLNSTPSAEILLEFDQSEKSKLRVYTDKYQGKKIIHIRNFYLKDNQFLHGKGLSFSVDLLVKMIDGLKQVPNLKKDDQ